MANWASVSYAIEGSRETLQKIEEAILMAMTTKDNKYEEYKACKNLGITFDDTKVYLGGTIEDEPWYDDGGALHLYAEERWGLQDFNELLEKGHLISSEQKKGTLFDTIRGIYGSSMAKHNVCREKVLLCATALKLAFNLFDLDEGEKKSDAGNESDAPSDANGQE